MTDKNVTPSFSLLCFLFHPPAHHCRNLRIVVLTNINIAENWFGLDEYTVVETRDQVIGYLPLLWYFVIALMIVLALFFGIRKRKRALFYWIGTLVILLASC